MKTNIFMGFLIFFLSLFTLASNDSLLQKITDEAKAASSDSLVIIEDGKSVVEFYQSGKDELQSVQSITKSVASLAIGILLDEGKISSLDEPMSQWIPEWKKDGVKSKITLRMIMQHTSGVTGDNDAPEGFFRRDDLVMETVNLPLKGIPGQQFAYSSSATILLTPVIAKSSGVSVEDYINEKIFKKLGIKEFQFKRDKKGNEHLGGGLSLKTEALIKLGKLVLNQGRFGGEQVIKAETLAQLLTKHQEFKDLGLLWWLDRPAGAPENAPYKLYSAIGYAGNYIVIYPEKNVVAVRTRNPKNIPVDNKAEFDKQYFSDFPKLISGWE